MKTGAGTDKGAVRVSKKVSMEGNKVFLTESTSERICMIVFSSVLGSRCVLVRGCGWG